MSRRIVPWAEAQQQEPDVRELIWTNIGKNLPNLYEDRNVDLEEIFLDGKTLDARISDSLVSSPLVRSIEGASTLTLTVHDRQRKLIKSRIFHNRLDIKVDDLVFRFVKLTKNEDNFDLIFEDRMVAWMRQYYKPRKAVRGTVTRAEFMLMLVREVKEDRIRVYCPELHKVQPITKAREKMSEPTRQRERRGGISRTANVTVKNVRATPGQVKNMNRVLDVAASLNASALAAKALLVACIQESTFKNLSGGDGDSAGILQVRTGLHGADLANDVEASAHTFLTKGFTGAGGAIKIAKEHPDWSPGQVAQAVQGSAFPDAYDNWKADAKLAMDAYTGDDEDGWSAGAPSIHVPKKYEFTKGHEGKRENIWDCLGRLCEEVNWRRFVVGNVLYIISEADLIKSEPRARITEDTEGIDWIDYDWDTGKELGECIVRTRTDRWDGPPGSVIVIGKEEGEIVKGRWLVSSIDRDLQGPSTTINLKKPMKELPEPAPETREVTQRSKGGTSLPDPEINLPKGLSVAEAQKLSTLYAACAAISEKSSGYDYGGGHGPALKDIKFTSGLDCSSSTSLALYLAGLFKGPTAWVSGMFASSWGVPGPGKYFTVWANDGHVWIELNIGKATRFDTGYGSPSGPRLRYDNRPTAGFVARHYPGL